MVIRRSSSTLPRLVLIHSELVWRVTYDPIFTQPGQQGTEVCGDPCLQGLIRVHIIDAVLELVPIMLHSPMFQL